MRIARETFNPYAQAVEETQGDIRLLVKRAYLYGLKQGEVNRALQKIITKATADIKIQRLKEDARISLLNFANKQHITWQSMGLTPLALLFLGKAVSSERSIQAPTNVSAELSQYSTSAVGVPLQRYYQDIWKERVQPVIDRLARDNALDPNDFTGRNSLRNLAEMEVRYHDHLDAIDSLQKSGVRLVVCSSHADCSNRCAKWQGRVYSLDGTSGVVDGHRYVPLETATDVWYTTKAGRLYKNGLLGFNCRHHITEYSGQLLPTVSVEERKREYAVTQRQRELELAVRKEKTFAIECKDINAKEYKLHKRRMKEIYDKYVKFSADNNRAYYPMRTSI